MHITFRQTDTNIYKYPTEINSTTYNELTIGDLHSNPIKFLYFLIQQGVLSFKDNPEYNYGEFVQLYSQHGELLSKLKQPINEHEFLLDRDVEDSIVDQFEMQVLTFLKLLNGLVVRDNPPLVRLIGDELADRGFNDIFILAILRHLTKNKVRLNILLSNHADEFITSYECDLRPSKDPILKQFVSHAVMDYMIHDLEIGSEDEINKIINDCYKPTLRLIDYSLNDEGISLFTHAPVAFYAIKNAAERLGVVYDDATKENLAKTIDAINLKFKQDYVFNHKVHQLTSKPEDVPRVDLNLIDDVVKRRVDMTGTYLIWNRWSIEQEQLELRPEKINGYKVHYVHGHDGFQSVKDHVINLDTACGQNSPLVEQRLFREKHPMTQLVGLFLVFASDDKNLADYLAHQSQSEQSEEKDSNAHENDAAIQNNVTGYRPQRFFSQGDNKLTSEKVEQSEPANKTRR